MSEQPTEGPVCEDRSQLAQSYHALGMSKMRLTFMELGRFRFDVGRVAARMNSEEVVEFYEKIKEFRK